MRGRPSSLSRSSTGRRLKAAHRQKASSEDHRDATPSVLSAKLTHAVVRSERRGAPRRGQRWPQWENAGRAQYAWRDSGLPDRSPNHLRTGLTEPLHFLADPLQWPITPASSGQPGVVKLLRGNNPCRRPDLKRTLPALLRVRCGCLEWKLRSRPKRGPRERRQRFRTSQNVAPNA